MNGNECPPEKSWESFRDAVLEAGLSPSKCDDSLWEIRGGGRCALVNCRPNTKLGFRIKAVGGPGYVTGTVADAIQLAGPPPPGVAAQAIRGADLPVGLIRRFWRWIW